MAKKAASKTQIADNQQETPVVDVGDLIEKTNRLYLSIKAIGTMNHKGKSVLSVGYGGKIAPPPDHGLEIAIVLIQELRRFAVYSSFEAAQKDLKSLQDFINKLKVSPPTNPTNLRDFMDQINDPSQGQG